jgi:hypothetical protein
MDWRKTFFWTGDFEDWYGLISLIALVLWGLSHLVQLP